MGLIRSLWGMLDERLSQSRASAPLVAIAFGVLAGAFGIDHWRWAIGFLALGILFVRSGVRWKLALLGFLALTAWRANQLKIEAPASQRMTRSATGELLLGRLTGMGNGERLGWLNLVQGEEIRVAVQEAANHEPGDLLLIDGRLFSPAPARNPAEFSLLRHWGQHSLKAGLDLHSAKKIGGNWQQGIWRYSERAKISFKKLITRGIEDDEIAAPIIVAMMLGETPASTSEITEAFRYSGAMHVFAVSGLHVTIVGGLVWGILLLCRIPRRPAVLLIIFTMVAYALITGGRAPAMRATLMATTFLSAFLLRRRPSLFNSLSMSMIIVLLWRPSQAMEIGFQLSYGVIASIGLGFALCYRWTGKMAELDELFPRRLLSKPQKMQLGFRGKIAAMAATSLAAWLGSLPWMAYHFGLVTPIAVLASLVLIPATFLVLALGLSAIVFGSLSPGLGEVMNHTNAFVARTAFHAARAFSAVPLGHQFVGSKEAADWVVFDFSDGGSASFLAAGDGALIDVGSERRYYQMIRPAMRRWHWSPETIVLSHPDAKHSGAISEVVGHMKPERVIIPVVWSRSPSYREFVDAQNSAVKVAKLGSIYPLSDDVWLQILRAGQEDLDTLADSRGMVTRVHWKGWKVLVMGDLGVEEEREMISNGIDLEADIVLIGRHGRTYSGSIEFLKATGAKVVIASSAIYPKKQNPTKIWRKAVRELGIELFVQGEAGAVLMDFETSELRVKSFLDPERIVVLER